MSRSLLSGAVEEDATPTLRATSRLDLLNSCEPSVQKRGDRLGEKLTVHLEQARQ